MRGRVMQALVGAAVLAACTGPAVKIDPPNSPNAVVSSADRLRDRQARLGGSSACLQDAYCAAGLTRVYGLSVGGAVDLETPAAVVDGLAAGAIDVGAIPATAVETADSRIAILRDDRRMQPANNVVPVVNRTLAVTGGSAVTAALDAISATLTPTGLAGIEQALAGGASAELAASGWLEHHSGAGPGPAAGAPVITVGARRNDESQAISDVYAGVLARRGWRVRQVTIDGGRGAELDALALNQVGVVPDTAANLLEALDGFSGQATSSLTHTLARLRVRLADLGLAALGPAPAAPATVFAVSRPVAQALSVTSLSELARASGARLPPLPPPLPLTAAEVAADTEAPPAQPELLAVGSSGPAVAELQARLAALGYRAPATGAFDETTRRAVVGFQIDAGLIDDGLVDGETLRALGSARPTTHPSAAPSAGDLGSMRMPPGRTVYLAFADGPSAITPQILDVLGRVGGRATFFADEADAGASPAALRSALAAGDAVGISAGPHDATSGVALDVLWRTVTASQVAIAAADGQTPTCLIAPYGATNGAARAGASGLGLRFVLWDLDPMDWTHPGPAAIAGDVLAGVRAGSVILLHDGGGDRFQTVTALETIVPALTAAGYTLAAIPGC